MGDLYFHHTINTNGMQIEKYRDDEFRCFMAVLKGYFNFVVLNRSADRNLYLNFHKLE